MGHGGMQWSFAPHIVWWASKFPMTIEAPFIFFPLNLPLLLFSCFPFPFSLGSALLIFQGRECAFVKSKASLWHSIHYIYESYLTEFSHSPEVADCPKAHCS